MWDVLYTVSAETEILGDTGLQLNPPILLERVLHSTRLAQLAIGIVAGGWLYDLLIGASGVTLRARVDY